MCCTSLATSHWHSAEVLLRTVGVQQVQAGSSIGFGIVERAEKAEKVEEMAEEGKVVVPKVAAEVFGVETWGYCSASSRCLKNFACEGN